MTFSYIINDNNEYGDLTVQPTLNRDYCLLIVRLTLWTTCFVWKTLIPHFPRIISLFSCTQQWALH